MGLEWNPVTVSDLWEVGLDEMQAKFGDEARWVYNVLRGIDYSEVRERVNNQTMLASKSVRPAITKPEEAMHWLSILATELAIRLREARQERLNLWPKTLVLRYIRAGSVPRSRQSAFPFTNPNNQEELAKVILKKGQKLWEESLGDALGLGLAASGSGGEAKILTIALGFGGLAEGEAGQRGIAGFLGSASNTAASLDADSTSIPLPASTRTAAEGGFEVPVTPKKKKKKHNRLENMFESQTKQQAATLPAAPVLAEDATERDPPSITEHSMAKEAGDPPPVKSGVEDREEDPQWRCPQCSQLILAPDGSAWFEKPYLVEKLKDEHLDWHFAVSLSQAPPAPSASLSHAANSNSSSSSKNKKRALDKFFTRR